MNTIFTPDPEAGSLRANALGRGTDSFFDLNLLPFGLGGCSELVPGSTETAIAWVGSGTLSVSDWSIVTNGVISVCLLPEQFAGLPKAELTHQVWPGYDGICRGSSGG